MFPFDDVIMQPVEIIPPLAADLFKVPQTLILTDIS